MENTNKTLLITASVLLIMLIISMSLYIARENSTIIESNTELSALEVQAHNSRYEIYKGTQSGNNVKVILNYAIEDNEKMGADARKPETEKWCVNIRSNDEDVLNTFKADSEIYFALTTRNHGVRYQENIKKVANAISSGKKYKISYSYTEAGYIWEIHIDSVES